MDPVYLSLEEYLLISPMCVFRVYAIMVSPDIHMVFIWYHVVSYGTWHLASHGIIGIWYRIGCYMVLSLSIIPLPWHRRSHDGHFDGAHTSADGGMFRSRQLLGCRGVAVQGKPQTVCWGSWADPCFSLGSLVTQIPIPFEPEVRDSATRDCDQDCLWMVRAAFGEKYLGRDRNSRGCLLYHKDGSSCVGHVIC